MSDTDYRQFVKYGNVTGFDMAYFQNSYVYHSSRDVYETIQPGSIQHLGEPSLEIVSYLMSSDLLDRPDFFAPKKVVYFDFFGLFLVRYPWAVAVAGNVILHLWSAFLLWRFVGGQKSELIRLVRLSGRIAVTFVGSLIIPAIFGGVMAYVFGQRLLWYRNEFLPSVYYGPLTIACALFFHSRNKPSSKGDHLQQAPSKLTPELSSILGYLLFVNGFAAAAALAGILTSYFFSIWVLFLNLGLVFSLPSHRAEKGGSVVHWATYALGYTFPLMYTADMLALLMDFLVPLSARLGFGTPVDVVLGVLSGNFAFFLFAVLLPLAQRYSSVGGLARLMMVASVTITLLMVFFSPPFDYLHPRRFYMQHHHDFDQGTSHLLTGVTEYTDLSPIPRLLEKYAAGNEILAPAPEHEVYWESLYPLGFFIGSHKVATETPRLLNGAGLERIQLTATSRFDESAGLRYLSLSCAHPGYPWTVLSFRAEVVDWSIPEVEPEPQEAGNKYVIRQVSGYGHHTWTLDLVVRGPEPVEFRMLGLVHEDSTLTREIVGDLPDWIDPTARMVVGEQRFTL